MLHRLQQQGFLALILIGEMQIYRNLQISEFQNTDLFPATVHTHTCVLTGSLYVAIQHIQNKCMILQPAQTFSPSSVSHLRSATPIHPVVYISNVNTSLLSHFQSSSFYLPYSSEQYLLVTVLVGTAQGQVPSYAVRVENYYSPNFLYLKQINNLYQLG